LSAPKRLCLRPTSQINASFCERFAMFVWTTFTTRHGLGIDEINTQRATNREERLPPRWFSFPNPRIGKRHVFWNIAVQPGDHTINMSKCSSNRVCAYKVRVGLVDDGTDIRIRTGLNNVWRVPPPAPLCDKVWINTIV